jgi:hypothetical protein
LLQIIFLNLTLDGVALCPERRKPFNPSTEELPLEKNRGNKTAIELFLGGIRALALQSSIIDVVRIASQFS